VQAVKALAFGLPGIVDKDVDCTAAPRCLFEGRANVLLSRDIAADDPAIGWLIERREGGLQGIVIPAHERNARAKASQPLRNGQANAARAARYERVPPFQWHGVVHFPAGCAYAAALSKLVSSCRFAGKYCLGHVIPLTPMRADSRSVQAASAKCGRASAHRS